MTLRTPRRKAELTQGELRTLLRSRVRNQLKMSLETFMEHRRSGTLPDLPGCAELDVLAGEREFEL